MASLLIRWLFRLSLFRDGRFVGPPSVTIRLLCYSIVVRTTLVLALCSDGCLVAVGMVLGSGGICILRFGLMWSVGPMWLLLICSRFAWYSPLTVTRPSRGNPWCS